MNTPTYLSEKSDLAEGWLQIGKELTVRWIPGHAGIEEGKEECKKRPSAAGDSNKASPLTRPSEKIRKMKDSNWLAGVGREVNFFLGPAQT